MTYGLPGTGYKCLIPLPQQLAVIKEEPHLKTHSHVPFHLRPQGHVPEGPDDSVSEKTHSPPTPTHAPFYLQALPPVSGFGPHEGI